MNVFPYMFQIENKNQNCLVYKFGFVHYSHAYKIIIILLRVLIWNSIHIWFPFLLYFKFVSTIFSLFKPSNVSRWNWILNWYYKETNLLIKAYLFFTLQVEWNWHTKILFFYYFYIFFFNFSFNNSNNSGLNPLLNNSIEAAIK